MIRPFSTGSKLEIALKELQLKIRQKNDILESMSQNERDWVQKWVLISTIGASTRIENAVLTDAEIEWVDTTLSSDDCTEYADQKSSTLNKFSKDRERSLEEVIGCRELLNIIAFKYYCIAM